MLSHLKKESMHHAYVVEGDIRHSRPAVFDFLRAEFGMDLGHNDLVLIDRGDFGVDNVREIIDVNSRKPTKGAYKAVVVILQSISHQAQNAILKTLEEPRPGTYIFILTHTSAIFLPTILSRVHVVRGEIRDENKMGEKMGKIAVGDDEAPGDARVSATHSTSLLKKNSKKHKDLESALSVEKFIENSPAERLNQIKEIISLKSDENIEDADIFNFMQQVERVAHHHVNGAAYMKELGVADKLKVSRLFTRVGEFMRDPSSSKKMLLEYIALKLPSF